MKHTKVVRKPIIRFIPKNPLDTSEEVFEKEYPRYTAYCYSELKKGSKPIYKIICNNKELLEHYTSEFCTINDLKTLPRFEFYYYKEYETLYDNPITINCETGEIVE